ncbi:MAG TPA: NUDIX domain-containing protein [Alphaproteobacteria bacterium]|nr:NUDIX domain-containing protein [Alphaproteobacteria bacterium]
MTMQAPAPPRFCRDCGAPLAATADGRLACTACGRRDYDSPIPVVAGIVEHEGSVLLVRARGWPEDWFGLVTGFLERGEAPDEGIRREVREELGLEPGPATLIGAYPFPEMNQVVIAYHLTAAGTVALSDELAACKPIPVHKLRPWPFATGRAVADWLARRGAAAGA